MSLSPRLERDLTHTLWLVRVLVYLVLGLVALVAIAGLAGLGAGLAGGGSASSTGTDVHARLTPGGTATATTEAGHTVRVDIVALTWAQGPVVTARVSGIDPDQAAGRWYLYLQDDTRRALQGVVTYDGTIRAALEGSLPAGSSVRFVHFDPDDSRGDIYFDVK